MAISVVLHSSPIRGKKKRHIMVLGHGAERTLEIIGKKGKSLGRIEFAGDDLPKLRETVASRSSQIKGRNGRQLKVNVHGDSQRFTILGFNNREVTRIEFEGTDMSTVRPALDTALEGNYILTLDENLEPRPPKSTTERINA